MDWLLNEIFSSFQYQGAFVCSDLSFVTENSPCCDSTSQQGNGTFSAVVTGVTPPRQVNGDILHPFCVSESMTLVSKHAEKLLCGGLRSQQM